MHDPVWAASNEDEAAALAMLNETGTRTLSKKGINGCAVRITDARNKLNAVKRHYRSTQAYHWLQRHLLTGQVRGHLAMYNQTKHPLVLVIRA